jgi:hypothetical protein
MCKLFFSTWWNARRRRSWSHNCSS